MSKRYSYALMLALAIQGPRLSAQTDNASLPSFVRDSLDTYVLRAMKAWNIPGVAVAVVRDGRVVVLKGYGVRSLDGDQPVDENTLFMIGSNTKAFTATLLTNLASQGKFSLDDKVTRWMPDFKMYDPNTTAQISVRDLMGHHTGLETFQGDFTYWTSDLTRAEVIQHFGLNKPVYPFRTKFGYCNAAFVTAGQLVPLITGKSWEEEVSDLLLKPLGMTRTLILSANLPGAENAAAPYTYDLENRLIRIPYNQIDNLAPAGSISSSASDLTHWVMMLLDSGRYQGNQIVPFSVLQSTRQPQTIIGHSRYPFNSGYYTLYGSGWFLDEYGGKELVYHTGGVYGFVSSVTLVPSEHLGIIVLTNTDQNYLYEALKMELLDSFLGLPYRDYSDLYLGAFHRNVDAGPKWYNREMDTVNRHPTPALALDAYAGKYTNPVYGEIEIRRKDDSLQIHFSHHPQLIGRLLPLGGNDFLCVYSDPELGAWRFPFTVENGRSKTMELTVNPEVEFTHYLFTRE